MQREPHDLVAFFRVLMDRGVKLDGSVLKDAVVRSDSTLMDFLIENRCPVRFRPRYLSDLIDSAPVQLPDLASMMSHLEFPKHIQLLDRYLAKTGLQLTASVTQRLMGMTADVACFEYLREKGV